MSVKFSKWIDELRESVIEDEYGYEPGEFSVSPEDWRPMFREGLTPQQAFRRALHAHSETRDEEDRRRLANWKRIQAADAALSMTPPPPPSERSGDMWASGPTYDAAREIVSRRMIDTGTTDGATLVREIVAFAATVRAEATRTERDACANVVEEHGDRCISPEELDDWYEDRIAEIAAAIRARTATQAEGKCQHAKSDITPCYRRDGDLAVVVVRDDKICVGCEKVIAGLRAAPRPPASPSHEGGMREALEAVRLWASKRCPCNDDAPKICPLCDADVEKDRCMAVDVSFPRRLREQIDAALAHDGERGRTG